MLALPRAVAQAAGHWRGNGSGFWIAKACFSGSPPRPMVHMEKGKPGKGLIGKPFPVEPARITAPLAVPQGVPRPSYADGGQPDNHHGPAEVMQGQDLDDLRFAAGLARDVLAAVGKLLAPGVTTDDLDAFVHSAIVEAGAYPAPLNYMGFPKSVCTSVNEVVCHGIPDVRPLEEGDVVSVDVSLFARGKFGDTCRTFVVPPAAGQRAEPDAASVHLICGAKAAMDAGIAAAVAGAPVSAIGCAISDSLAGTGLDSVRDFCGHGIGSTLHTQPLVLHYANRTQHPLRPGMVLTVEPMLTQGSAAIVRWGDNWTISTVDRGLAAQFEHMVLITPGGGPPEVLTGWEGPHHSAEPWLPGQAEGGQ